MPTEYNNKPIKDYERDIERIMKETDKNGKQMSELITRRAADLETINQLRAENERLKTEWAKISGKIELLKEIADSEV